MSGEGRRNGPAPRAQLHQLDDDTLLGALVFAALLVVAVVLVVRAHPWCAVAAAGLLGAIWIAARRIAGALLDRQARRGDPPAPGVIIGHVQGDWPAARSRPFRLPWPAFRQHVLIAGPTGRGKTYTFVEPLLRAHVARAGTGVFYLDGKGDPVEKVPFDCVFCPEQPEQSAHWNPLAGEDPVAAAGLFAAGLFPEAASPDTPGAFYAARAVYAISRVAPAMAFTGYGTDGHARVKLPDDSAVTTQALIDHGVEAGEAAQLVRTFGSERVAQQLAWSAHREEDKRSPERLAEAIRRAWDKPQTAPARYDVTLAQLSRVLFATAKLRELAGALHAEATLAGAGERGAALEQLRHDLDGLLALPDRDRAAVFQSLQNRLGYFLEPPFAELCARSDFAVADVAGGARIAFLLPTGRFPNTAKPLGRVVLSQFKNAVLASSPDREKVAVLDEFHNFVSADFAAFLNQARSRGGAAIMALQSLGDLPRDETDAMLANISTLIVTPGSRPRDAEYFAEAFGKVASERHSISYEAPSPLELRARPLVRTDTREDYRYTPTEIAELDPREALIQVTAGRRSWPATRVIVERAHG